MKVLNLSILLFYFYFSLHMFAKRSPNFFLEISVGAAIMFRSGLLSRWEQDRSAVLIGRANLSSRLGVQPSGKIPATKEL